MNNRAHDQRDAPPPVEGYRKNTLVSGAVALGPLLPYRAFGINSRETARACNALPVPDQHALRTKRRSLRLDICAFHDILPVGYIVDHEMTEVFRRARREHQAFVGFNRLEDPHP